MSMAERRYKALSMQGKLTPEEKEELKSDLFRLLNTKERPKSDTQLQQELVRFCGWNRHKIFGPRPYVWGCLENLETEGLIESHGEAVKEVVEAEDLIGEPRRFYWRK